VNFSSASLSLKRARQLQQTREEIEHEFWAGKNQKEEKKGFFDVETEFQTNNQTNREDPTSFQLHQTSVVIREWWYQ
jgi:hypothetical protein